MLLATGLAGCGGPARPPAVAPPLPVAPAVVPPPPAPASTSATIDPAAPLIADAEAHYNAGCQQLQAGHLVAAREEFDLAVDVLLDAPEGARASPSLQAYFEKLLDQITALETVALRQGDGFTETRSEPAVIDELLAKSTLAQPEPTLTTAEAVAADMKAVTYDLPMTVNDKVLSYVEQFQGTLRPFLEEGLSRGAQYLPMIRDVFREEHLPLDLAYVPLIESAFKSNALSRASAKGMWQFESDTAREEGLTQNWFVDERSDPEKATRAAADYLKSLNQMFGGDWYLTLASYNGGMGRVQRAIERSGLSDYWALSATSKYLPRDTREYVPMILAAIIIARNPTRYGFDVTPLDPIAYDTVTVPDAIDLRRIAEWTGVTIDDIRQLNPELRRMTTPVGQHEIKVPAGTGAALQQKLASADPSEFTTFQHYVVRRGDTLSHIASRFSLSTADLIAANELHSTRVRAGMSLMIPSHPSALITSHASASAGDSHASVGTPVVYSVRRGDTLYGIAQRFDTTVDQLKQWNGLTSNSIGIGDKLTVYRPR